MARKKETREKERERGEREREREIDVSEKKIRETRKTKVL